MDSDTGQQDLLQQLILRPKKKFIKEYAAYDEASARKLCLLIFTKLKNAVILDNVDILKDLHKFINNLISANNKVTLKTCYNHNDNILKNTNLVILACKHDKQKSLQYLFDNYDFLININCAITPRDLDEERHNAFYYAIRLDHINILQVLIDKWPGTNSDELDEVLSQAYVELKLKNVALSNEMEVFVEETLINLRFYSDDSSPTIPFKVTAGDIQERIDLVLENIALLISEYFNAEVDENFLYITTFIVKNIHVLKRSLRSTYDILPWEEIEFCLVSFVKSYAKQEEIHLLYKTVLKKEIILTHLRNFAFILNGVPVEEGDLKKLRKLPNIPRDNIIERIIKNYPPFQELCDNYEEIIDVYSLNRIKHYTDFALSADTSKEEEKLIIIRALQVIGEYMKNSLESPKLSTTTSGLLLQSLQNDTKDIVKNLRNSLSHTNSLQKRTQIEDNTDICFYTNIQNDIKKINSVITGILFNFKIKRIRVLLKTIINSSSVNEIRETQEAFQGINLYKIIAETKTPEEDSGIEELIVKLSNKIHNKTSEEIEIFNQIINIIKSEKAKLGDMKYKYIRGLMRLKVLSSNIFNEERDHNELRNLKYSIKNALELISLKIDSDNCNKRVIRLLKEIYMSVDSRTKFEDVNLLLSENESFEDSTFGVRMFFNEVIQTVTFDMFNIKWIEDLRDKLKGNCDDSTSAGTRKKELKLTDKQFDKQLTLKLALLGDFLNKNSLVDFNRRYEIPYYNRNDALNFTFYKEVLNDKSENLNCKIQIILEMLLLDVMSILESCRNVLNENPLYLDNNLPALIGKNLRNHLAHGNTIIDILSLNPAITIVSNAKKINKDNIIEINRKIGKIMEYNYLKLKDLHNQNLITILNQRKMFIAIAEGNFEEMKICIHNGADVRGRTTNLWTSLHFAAKQTNIEIVKFLHNQNINVNAKDLKHRKAIHIAAIHGTKNFIEYFMQNQEIMIEETEINGKTLLHLAAQNGHENVIELLLQHKASTTIKDVPGNSPLHYAIYNGHANVAKILLAKEQNVDINQTLGSFTALHYAAERGHIEIVNYLLENNANVNAKTDDGFIPLHISAINGHIDVVQALISKGSNVNSRVEDGSTALHYAVETNHKEIVKLLIQHGADVNIVDKIYLNTPIINASRFGYKEIVEILLKNNANINMKTIDHMTALHFAASDGHLDIVILLLKSKADINSKDSDGCNALHLSAYFGYIEVVKILLKHGSHLNAGDKNKRTPLQAAVINGHKEVVEFLLLQGADVNSVDATGSTALHICSKCENGDIAKMLIEKGAKVNINNHFNDTPLREALKNDCTLVVEILIQKGANIKSIEENGLSALNFAALHGSKKSIEFLLDKINMDINQSEGYYTPLHLAIMNGKIEIAKLLIQRGCDINGKSKNETPLSLAVENNIKEMVDILLEHGADVNEKNGRPLQMAIKYHHKNIFKTLLCHENINLELRLEGNTTLLHFVATFGDKSMAETLLKRGVEVDPLGPLEGTPLVFAACKNNIEVVEVLLAYKANANVMTMSGESPLHWAAVNGASDVVKLLLNSGAETNIFDLKNRIPIELAVAHGHLDVVKMLLQYAHVNMSGNDGYTMLHIAAQDDHFEIARFLIQKGANINARNDKGSKPIHIAAREGAIKILQYLFDETNSINDYGAFGHNLLHYAALKSQLEILKYLNDKKFNVNLQDWKGLTPLHVAAAGGCKEAVKLLLNNGANYKSADVYNRKPVDLASEGEVIRLLTTTENFYAAVTSDNAAEVERTIKEGAVVNVKNFDNVTPLHHASCKGYERVVDILLKNQADPNLLGKSGCTPLHYAAKFGHIGIVRKLLSHGATYDVKNDKNKVPLDLAEHEGTIALLKLVTDSFINVQNGNIIVINRLNEIKDVITIKAIMNARNKENKNIIVTAIHNDFPKIKQLKEVFQDNDVPTYLLKAEYMKIQENYKEALNIYKIILEKRRKIFGPDDPAILDIQNDIALMLYKQHDFKAALKLIEEIYEKRRQILGINNKDTLNVKSEMGLTLHRLGEDKKALVIFEEVYEKQSNLLGPNDNDVTKTQTHMALVLRELERFDEALKINYEVYERHKETHGIHHQITLVSQNNIAMVLTLQGNYDEATKMYKYVYETRKIVLGPTHSDTLRALHNMAQVQLLQQKQNEALASFTTVYNLQKSTLGSGHLDTIRTQIDIAATHFDQGNYIAALKVYKVALEKGKPILGLNHPYISIILFKMNLIKQVKFESTAPEGLRFYEYLNSDIHTAAAKGDRNIIESLIVDGTDVNTTDSEGRTPLHFAVSNNHKEIVQQLLQHNADVTFTTNKGNTPLHIAASKGNKDIIKIILNHLKQNNNNKLIDFIDVKTNSGGSSALHVAATNNLDDIANILLQYGAAYNVTDNNNKTPSDLSTSGNLTNLFKFLNDFFKDAKTGNHSLIDKLQIMNREHFIVITNARNKQGNTLLQVAMKNKHIDLARKLGEILKNSIQK